MDVHVGEARAAGDTPLITRLSAILPGIAALAAARDASGSFPDQEVAALGDMGALAAPLPRRFGGEGIGTEASGGYALLAVLRGIGGASLPLGRLYEGHVNALRLVMRYGDSCQCACAARDAAAGHLFGVWNTEPPTRKLLLRDGQLHGDKSFASGAGHVTRPLVTATTAEGERLMLLLHLAKGERADLSDWRAQGMRASASGRVRLDGIAVAPSMIVGGPGDYLRPPDFQAGAWRASAVAVGGLDALVLLMRQGLQARGRDAAPLQRARLGEALIAQETARLWLARAATLAEDEAGEPEAVVAYVGLARRAVETACLAAMQLAQRSLGLSVFMTGDPVERICRDLATYLRQPAGDETLDVAAGWFVAADLPEQA